MILAEIESDVRSIFRAEHFRSFLYPPADRIESDKPFSLSLEEIDYTLNHVQELARRYIYTSSMYSTYYI